MDVFLDSHAILWFLSGDSKLPTRVREIIEDERSNCYVSIASFWEITIKLSLGKLNLLVDLEELFEIAEKENIKILQIQSENFQILKTLPHFHKDPFDRLLNSQAITNDLTIVSKDSHFDHYPVRLLW